MFNQNAMKSYQRVDNSGNFTFIYCTVYVMLYIFTYTVRNRGNMPRINQNKINKVQNILEQYKLFTFQQLLKLLNCSTRTGRLKIKQWGVYNSYNKNGSYYTMPSVPEFDENGFWFFQNVYFSKHGNLKQTVIHLITTSRSGLTGRQIGEIINLSHSSFMHHFRNVPDIKREKHEGVYVYFSAEPRKYKQQLQNISTIVEKPISNVHAMVILISVIKHYAITVNEIAALPEIKELNISKNSVYNFMVKHGLLKKITDTMH